MINDVIQRLASFGYDVTDADEFALNFLYKKVENHIKSSCNILSIPEGLHILRLIWSVGNFCAKRKQQNRMI